MIRGLKLAAVFVAASVVMALAVPAARADVQIQAGGATFPEPIYQQFVKDYVGQHGDQKVAYVGKGSGAGIGGLLDKTFDFCGSDAPMNPEELKKAGAAGGEVVQIPSVAGAVVLAYNVPGVATDLKLSGPVVADIYLGKITNWNDKAIKELNPGVNFPSLSITPIHRSDGSGTNYVFSSYLCTQSDEFQTKVGNGKTVKWPGGQGGQGNPGCTQALKSTVGAITYIELNYAIDNKIDYALVQNNDGKFIKASPQSVAAAGEGALKDMDEQKTLTVRLWARDGADVYPIAAYTYLICYKDLSYLKDKSKAQAIVDFFWYATHDGQNKAVEMTYAPLSKGVQNRAEKVISTITFDGAPLHPAN